MILVYFSLPEQVIMEILKSSPWLLKVFIL